MVRKWWCIKLLIEDAIKEFSTRIGIDIQEFSVDKPICFKIDNKYHYCLEYRKNLAFNDDYEAVDEPLVLTLKIELPPYDQETIVKFLKNSSVFAVNKISYKVGFNNDYLFLMHDISLNFTAPDLENAIVLLKQQYEEVIADD